MDALEANFTLLDATAMRSKAYARLTRQQEKYSLCRLRGGGVPDCREEAGLPREGRALEQSNENVFKAMQIFRESEREEAAIDRRYIKNLLLSSHAKAVEVRDEINAAVHLGKLYGLFESDKQKGTKVNLNVTTSRLEMMTDDDLLSKSGFNLELQPQERKVEVIDVEPIRIPDTTDA